MPPCGGGSLNGKKPTPANGACHIGTPNTKPGIREERRGRKAATVPSPKHLEILNATRIETYQQVGARHGCSRQRIGEIVRRWPSYAPVRSLPKQKPAESCPTGTPPKVKENKNHIICYRLTTAEAEMLRERYRGMKSINRVARHIVTKVLSI